MTAHQQIPLFRTEVLTARRDRLHGDISLAVPMSWQAVGYLLFGAIAAALFFLASASYSRVETVSGAVVVDKGTAAIVPTRAGVVVDVPISDGQQVAAGEVLARVRSEDNLTNGGTVARRMLDSLQEQDRQLGNQATLVLNAAAAERSRLMEAAAGARQEIGAIDQQIADQQRLLSLAENDYNRVQGIAANGFISRRDLEAREASLLARRQQLAQLRQARAAKLAEAANAERASAQAEASARAQAAAVQSQRTQLVQQVAQADSSQGYALTSPIAGTVTAVTARLGQPATQGQPLMVVVPQGGRTRVELYVPTSAAGFLERGQEVRLAIDAFPYQQFGTVPARITDVATAAVMQPTGNGRAVPVYLVIAELGRDSVQAFGDSQRLVPGMTLSARIVTRRQSLLEWLFEPLFAVSRR